MLALLTALVGPFFVDWNAFRSNFEAQAEAMLGHRVRVDGTADARILPLPSLTFTDVRIGEAGVPPLMTVKRFSVRVELFPLLQGEVRVVDMALDEPSINVRITEDGAFEWLKNRVPARIDPKKVVLEKVEIRNGRIVVADERRAADYYVTGVNALVDARTLAGPYKFDGAAVFGGEPAMIRAAAGEADERGEIRVSAEILPAGRPLSIALDGKVGVEGGEPHYAGTLAVNRVIAEGDTETTPLRLAAGFELDPFRLLLKEGEMRVGPEDRPLVISGAANVTFADAPYFDAVLSSRQIDVDRALGGGAAQPVGFSEALGGLAATLAALPKPPIPGQIGFDIPGVVVGGDLVQNLRFDAATRDGGWYLQQLEARLPGQSDLAATGELTVGETLGFRGHAALSSRQPETLVSWWRPGASAGRLPAFSFDAEVAASADAVSLSDLDARIGEATVAGSLTWDAAVGARKAHFSAVLSADTLDLEAARALGAVVAGRDPAASLTETDFALTLTADAVGLGEATARGVDVDARLEGGTLGLDRFRIADLAGAAITASGRVVDIAGAPDGKIEASLSAERTEALAALLGRLAPGAASFSATAAPVIAPLRLRASLDARAEGGDTVLAGRLEGGAGATKIATDLAFTGRPERWRDGSVRLAATLEGPNGARIMRQLGFPVDDDGSAGAGRVGVDLDGVPSRSLAITTDAALGTTAARVEGEVAVPAGAAARADLALAVKSDDFGPVLALSGPRLASLTRSLPLDLSARLALADGKLTLAGLRGDLVGTAVSGDLALDLAPRRPHLSGALSADAVDFAALAELALGSGTLDPPVTTSSPWPEVPFGPALIEGLDGVVSLSTRRLALAGDLVAEGASARLRASATGFAVEEIAGRIAGGALTGSLSIRRDGEGAADVALRARLEGAALDELVWQRGGRAVASGRLDAHLDVEGIGRSVSGVVAGLGGGGGMTISDGVIRSLNPAAFGAVTRAVDAGLTLESDDIARAFTAQVDSGDLAFSRLEGSFTVAGGTLRAPRIAVAGASAATGASAIVDLSAGTLSSDWTLTVDAGADAVAGAQPQVAILFRGPVAEPARSIDVTAFTAYLTLRAFEREVRRVEAMQSDILERETFSRQLKRMKQDRELATRDAEAARVEAERQAAEAAAEAERAAAAEAERRLREALPDGLPQSPAPPLGVVPPLDLDPSGALPAPGGGGGAAPISVPAGEAPSGAAAAGAVPVEAVSGDGDFFSDEIRRKLDQLMLDPLPPPIEVGPTPGGG